MAFIRPLAGAARAAGRRGMATWRDTAQIARAVYGPADANNKMHAALTARGWTSPVAMQVNDSSIFSGGSPLSSGFQGRVYLSGDGKDAVIAFKGTVPTQTSDLVSDLQLAMGFMPRQAKDALKSAEDWKAHLGSRNVLVVGHSLGGALAQIVGVQAGLDFLTYNSPGMKHQADGLSSSQSSAGRGGSGLNLRTGGAFAPIAALGEHLGPVQVVEAAGTGHSIDNFVDYFDENRNIGDQEVELGPVK